MKALAYLNGKIMPLSDALVPVEDRGYQFGDAVYEGIASYDGKIFALQAHVDRLARSMAELNFPPLQRDVFAGEVKKFYAAANIERAFIYIQVSRGVAPRQHAYPENPIAQTVMTVTEIPPTHEFLEKGVRAITVDDIRWGRCDIKTVQLLPNALAKRSALDQGVYDAIFQGPQGVVREATSSNLFIVQEGKLLTHPLTPNILPGITRETIIAICRDEGLPVKEAFFDQKALYAAQEVFLTGTTTEVLSIVEIDGRTIADGSVGPVSRRLFKAFRRLVAR